MFAKHKKLITKYLNLVLGHQPELIGLKPDEAGWVQVHDLLFGMNKARRRCNRVQLAEIVNDVNEHRFEFNADKTQIRATAGHQLNVGIPNTDAADSDPDTPAAPE